MPEYLRIFPVIVSTIVNAVGHRVWEIPPVLLNEEPLQFPVDQYRKALKAAKDRCLSAYEKSELTVQYYPIFDDQRYVRTIRNGLVSVSPPTRERVSLGDRNSKFRREICNIRERISKQNSRHRIWIGEALFGDQFVRVYSDITDRQMFTSDGMLSPRASQMLQESSFVWKEGAFWRAIDSLDGESAERNPFRTSENSDE